MLDIRKNNPDLTITITINLLSVTKMVDKGNTVILEKNCAVVKDVKSETKLMANRTKHLYYTTE